MITCAAIDPVPSISVQRSDADSPEWTIHGNIPGAKAGQKLVIRMLNPESDGNDIMGRYNYVNEVSVQNGGTFELAVKLRNQEGNIFPMPGWYTITVDGIAGMQPLTTEEGFFSRSYIDSMYVAADTAKDTGTLISIIDSKNGRSIFPLDYNGRYKTLKSKDEFYKILLSKDLSTPEKITTEFNAACVIRSLIESVSDEEAFSEVLEYYTGNHILNIEAKAYDTYMDGGLFDSGSVFRLGVAGRLPSAEIYHISQYEEAFKMAVINEAFHDVVNWSQIKNVLDHFDNLFHIQWASYNQLENKKPVLESFVNRAFTRIEDVKPAFDREVSAQSNSEDSGDDDNHVSNKKTGGGGGSNFYVDSIPQPNVTPVPSPTSTPVEKNLFGDLDNVSWAKEAITVFVERGIISVPEEKKFRPNDAVTREEFTKMMIEALMLRDDTAVCNFDDVQKDSWYYSYIASARKYSIINGISEDRFGTGSSLTREQLAAMAYRACAAISVSLPEDQTDFADKGEIDESFRKAVGALSSIEIIKGMEGRRFAPREICTRAQAVVILQRIMEYAGIIK